MARALMGELMREWMVCGRDGCTALTRVDKHGGPEYHPGKSCPFEPETIGRRARQPKKHFEEEEEEGRVKRQQVVKLPEGGLRVVLRLSKPDGTDASVSLPASAAPGKVVTGPERAECQRCHRLFSSLHGTLARHQRSCGIALADRPTRVRVQCPEEGCGELLLEESMAAHQRICGIALADRRVQCPNEGCGKLLSESSMPGHQRICGIALADRRVQCPNAACGKLLLESSMAWHQPKCGIALADRRVQCPRCDRAVVPEMLDGHLLTHDAECVCDGCGKPYVGNRSPTKAKVNPSLDGSNLCARCSRVQYYTAGLVWPGSFTVSRYCIACAAAGSDAVVAGFDDKDGNQYVYCKKHAKEQGTCSSMRHGVSLEASDALQALEKQLDLDFKFMVRFAPGEEPEGCEVRVLANASPLQTPDAAGYDAAGRRVVAQYHGDYFHGFPIGHVLHETFGAGHQWGPAQLNKTRRKTEMLITGPHLDLDGTLLPTGEGYDVYEIWGSQWKQEKARCEAGLAPSHDWYIKHEHDPTLDMSEEGKAKRDLSCSSMPEGEHTHGAPCELCKSTKAAAKAAGAAAAAVAAAEAGMDTAGAAAAAAAEEGMDTAGAAAAAAAEAGMDTAGAAAAAAAEAGMDTAGMDTGPSSAVASTAAATTAAEAAVAAAPGGAGGWAGMGMEMCVPCA